MRAGGDVEVLSWTDDVEEHCITRLKKETQESENGGLLSHVPSLMYSCIMAPSTQSANSGLTF